MLESFEELVAHDLTPLDEDAGWSPEIGLMPGEDALEGSTTSGSSRTGARCPSRKTAEMARPVWGRLSKEYGLVRGKGLFPLERMLFLAGTSKFSSPNS